MKALKIIAALALFLTLAAGKGCETHGKLDASVALPKAPAHYRACFEKLTDIPIESLDRARVVRLVAELRRSEKAKSQCGRDLLAWYEVVRAGYAKGGKG